jgi:alpha-glucosidase (family GH31 glycosyl hydrolase)
MLGDSILVAPVLAPDATTLRVYLPAGDWVDAFTGAAVPAGIVAREVPIDELPVYVRAADWPALRSIFTPLDS